MNPELMKQSEEVRQSCSTPGWDGYGAEPVTLATVEQACAFAGTFPPDLPVPTVGIEADGHITFEWYRTPQEVLSVSVDATGTLYYAALLGAQKAQGTEVFRGRMPDVVVNLITRLGLERQKGNNPPRQPENLVR